MAINNGKLEGRIVVPTGGWAIDADDSGAPFTATVPAGNYYLSSADSTANDFLAELASQLNSSGTDTWTVTGSLGESGTGIITIDCSATYSVTWDAASEDCKDLLGFNANISSASTPTAGALHARSVWLPDCPPQTLYGASSAGWYETSTRGQTAPDGTSTVLVGPKRTANAITWPAISQARHQVAYESSTNESYEKWWLDQVQGEGNWASHAGRIRWYPDADTDATYTTYTMVGGVEHNKHAPLRQNWGGFYRVEIPRLIKVG